MASRMRITLLALVGLIASSTFAQKGDANYAWVLDSSKRSVKNMPQQNEFINNQYPYPSKPRSQWELGISGGHGFIIGDRPGTLSEYNGGLSGGISARKALSHVFSVRGGYNGSKVSIPNYKALVGAQNETHMLGVDLIASLNAISSYRGNPKTDIYTFIGYNFVASRVKTYQALPGDAGFHTLYYEPKNLAGSFGPSELNNRKAWGTFHAASFGGGIAFKVSDKLNIGVEERFVTPLLGQDFLDGNKIGNSGDMYAYSQVRFNFNMGSTAKNVAPLWWLNPNNYIYNEVNAPKHMKMPPVVLPDADGDGVTDQFDMEPNTPAGSPVDSHGVSRDTDGDGIPDFRDKEPLTGRDCFPVDADGIGKCPEPPCCAELRNRPQPPVCAISSLPSVQFKTGTIALSPTATAVLSSVAAQMNANPACNVQVNGYYEASNKRSQQLSWDRVNSVIKYLVEKQGISESRLIFNLSGGGDVNTVDLMGTTQSGPNTVPAPFPNLQKSK